MVTKNVRVFFLALLLLVASPLAQVARCQSDIDVTEAVEEVGDLGIVGEDVQDFGDGSFSPAPGVDTICFFPKNSARVVPAGEETELLVGMKNDGEATVNVIAIKASLHLPFDHSLLVQILLYSCMLALDSYWRFSFKFVVVILKLYNFFCLIALVGVVPFEWMGSLWAFNNVSVPASAQATFPYIFAVSKFLQPGTFDLVGTIVYEIDQNPYQSTFHNGTIEVVEAGNVLSIESVFLVTLGIALLVLLGVWIRGQIKNLSKKTKRSPKVEVGTKTTDASMDEWLQGTAYTQSLSGKSKKKK
ncbi:hypothetical protein SLA2020_417640 [Shorea laevis]